LFLVFIQKLLTTGWAAIQFFDINPSTTWLCLTGSSSFCSGSFNDIWIKTNRCWPCAPWCVN